MTFAGSFTNNGTLSNGSNTQIYTFTGGEKTINGIATIQFETLNINSGASITLNRAIDIASGFTATINGTLNCGTNVISGLGSVAVNGTLGVGSTNASDALAANVTAPFTLNSGSTVNFNGSGPQTVGQRDYYNLTVSGNRSGASVTFGSGTLGIITSFNPTASNVTYAFNSNNTIEYKLPTTGSSTTILPPTFTHYHNLSINQLGNTIGPAGLVVDGTLNVMAGSFNSASDYHHVVINSGGTLTLSGPITVSGDWTNNGTLTHNNNSVTFDGTGAQTVTTGGVGTGKTFAGFVVNKSSGTATLAGGLGAGFLTVTAGTFDQGATFGVTTSGTGTVATVGSSGTWTNFGTGDLTLSGNVSNSGLINFNGNGTACNELATNDISINSTGARTWSGTGTFSMTDVTVSNQSSGVPPVTILVNSGTNAGGNTGWTFVDQCTAGTYTWIGGTVGANADWQVTTNWNPTRATPAAGDILIFDGTATPAPTVTNVPTQTISSLQFKNDVNPVKLNAAALGPHTLTITGNAGLDVQANSRLELVGSTGLTVAVTTGSGSTINGQIALTGGSHRLTGANAGQITFSSDAIFTAGTTSPASGFTGHPFGQGTNDSVRFQDGSNAFFNEGDDPFGGTDETIVTFNLGSNQEFNTSTAWAAEGRSYGNLTLAGATQTYFDSTASNQVTVMGNLTIAATNTVKLSDVSGGDMNLWGNFTDNGTFDPNGRTVKFQGTSLTQTIWKSSGGETFFNLLIGKTGGSLQLLSPLTINGALTFDGLPASAVDVLELNGQTLTLNGTVGAVPNPNSGLKGDLNGSGLNYTSSALVLAPIHFVSGGRSLSSLTVNSNSAWGVNFDTDVTIGRISGGTPSLNLTNGVVQMFNPAGSAFTTLTVNSNVTVTQANFGCIQGNEQRKVVCPSGSCGTLRFHVCGGSGNAFVDEAISVTDAGQYAQTIRAVGEKHPNITGANALNNYWVVSSISGPGSATADMTFHYNDGMVGTANESNFKIFRYNGSFTQFEPTSLNTTNNFATLNGVSQFSDWTLAEAAAVEEGTLQFSAANYNDTEQNSSTHTATITVQRTGGSDGAVSVHWATSAVTATAGTDYVEAFGDLNWADGDVADKTFTITVNGDTDYEANETVNITLSAPTGGATIGGTNPATLTVTNDDGPPSTSLEVNSTADTNDGACLAVGSGNGCTLREAVNAANANSDTSTITFLSGLTGTVTLGSQLDITTNVNVTGPGVSVITISGNNSVRVFRVLTGTFNLSGLTITDARDGGGGSGMFTQSGTTVNIDQVWFTGNHGPGAAACIMNNGTLRVTNSTFSGNDANGGPVMNINGGTATYINSTISGNTSTASGALFVVGGTLNVINTTITNNSAGTGGGIRNLGGTVNIRNTIVAGNSAGTGPDVHGSFNTMGHNLIGKSDGSTGFTDGSNGDQVGTIALPKVANLDALANYGGPTQTHRLQSGSTAIDAGDNCVYDNTCSPALGFAVTNDQRGAGFPRKLDGNGDISATVDIGAFEAPQVLVGAALDFDGVDDYVTVPSDPAVHPTSAITIEAWVKPAAAQNYTYARIADNESVQLLVTSSTNFRFQVSTTTGQGSVDAPFTPGNWYHVAATYDGAMMRIYLNGSLVASAARTGAITASTQPLLLGFGYDPQFGKFQVDEFRLWSRALCETEIQAQMNCELAGTESGLVAYYKFNQGVAGGSNAGVTTATDSAGTDNNGTLTNFALTGATSNWVAPGGVTTGDSCPAYLAPEMKVSGNSVEIPDGDATPAAADHTDFDGANVSGGSVTRTFTIENTGTDALAFTGTPKVSISGTNAAEFTVTAQPSSPIAASGSTTFQITFDPAGTGLRTAAVSIVNGDCDENPYDFVIQGTGTTPPTETDVVVDGSGNLLITDGNGGTSNDTLTISLDSSNIRVTDPNNTLSCGASTTQFDANTCEVPQASVTGNIQVNTLSGNDTLTLNLGSGDFIPNGGLSYAGGSQTSTGDKLIITGGNQGAVTYNYTNASDGNIVMSNFGTVSYTGLEPISNSGTADDIIFNLPAAGTNFATLGDDGATSNTMSRLSSLGTFETTDFVNPTGSLTLNRGTAADGLTVNALPDFNASLTVGSGANPFSAMLFDGAVTLAANKSLSVEGSEVINIEGANLATSGTGTVTFTTTRNINLVAASSISVLNGNLTLSGNAAGTKVGQFSGLTVDNSVLTTSGIGNISLTGVGGAQPGGTFLRGISVRAGAAINSTATVAGAGSITLNGTGGDGTGGFGSSVNDYGVSIDGVGTAITSQRGAISITGTGGTANGASSAGLYGVYLSNSGKVQADGAGAVTINGTGGNVTSGGGGGLNSAGVVLDTGGLITSTGTGASAAVVNLNANANAGGGGSSQGFRLDSPATVKTVDGNLQISGAAGTCALLCLGSSVRGSISASGTASITLSGNTGSGGTSNVGANVRSGGVVSVKDGNLTVIGLISGLGGSKLGVEIGNSGTGTLQTTGGGSISVESDTISINATDGTINGGSNTVSIRQRTAGGAIGINLGSTVDTTPNTLELSDAELDRITAGTLNIGDANSGAITISGGIDLTDAPVIGTLTLVTGANITETFAGNDLTVGALNITAPTGIGGSGGQALDLAVTTLKTDSTGSNGDQFLNELDAVDVGPHDLNAGTGAITLYNSPGGRFNTTGVGGDILSHVTVASSATLGGSGSVSSTKTTTVESGGSISPGASSGTLSTGQVTFNAGSSFNVEINGTTVTTGYDQLNVTGLVTLGGATLNLSGTHTPALGNTFIIVNNDSTDAITGTFTMGTGGTDANGALLAEGDTITNFLGSGRNATITYAGGTNGNDAVLTVVNPVVGVTVSSPASVTENGATNLIYTFERSGNTGEALTVNFSVGGVAAFSTDYTQTGADTFNASAGTVTFGAGNATAQLEVNPTGDATPELNETVVLTVTSGAGYTIGSSDSATGTIANDDESVSAGQLIISEFRLSGPGGANDEFIELYNSTDQDLFVTTTDGSAGWAVATSSGVEVFHIPNGITIAARGHFLGTNTSGYSLNNYPAGAGTFATGNGTWTTDVPDNTALAVFRTNNAANYTETNRLDSVGPNTETNPLYKEGTGYAPLVPADLAQNLEHTFFRQICVFHAGCPTPGRPRDTQHNAADFIFADTVGTSTSAGQRLGSPGPENLSSPIKRDPAVNLVLLDASVADASAPNRDRNTISDSANASLFGTITIRRRVVNQTGGTVTRLRFRVIDMTTRPSGPLADLRLRSSSDQAGVAVNHSDTCSATGTPSGSPPPLCTVTVNGLTLEQPPNHPAENGAGMNSTLTVALPEGGLPDGQSINVNFLLGVQKTGHFRFYLVIEALP